FCAPAGWSLCGSLAFFLPVAGLAFGRKGRQCLVPKLVEPPAQRAEPVGVDVIDAAGALPPVRHQACLLQDLEMLRHCGAAHRQAARERTHGLGARPEPPEHAPAGPGRAGPPSSNPKPSLLLEITFRS